MDPPDPWIVPRGRNCRATPRTIVLGPFASRVEEVLAGEVNDEPVADAMAANLRIDFLDLQPIVAMDLHAGNARPFATSFHYGPAREFEEGTVALSADADRVGNAARRPWFSMQQFSAAGFSTPDARDGIWGGCEGIWFRNAMTGWDWCALGRWKAGQLCCPSHRMELGTLSGSRRCTPIECRNGSARRRPNQYLTHPGKLLVDPCCRSASCCGRVRCGSLHVGRRADNCSTQRTSAPCSPNATAASPCIASAEAAAASQFQTLAPFIQVAIAG